MANEGDLPPAWTLDADLHGFPDAGVVELSAETGEGLDFADRQDRCRSGAVSYCLPTRALGVPFRQALMKAPRSVRSGRCEKGNSQAAIR